MFRSPTVGENQFDEFIAQRLINNAVSYFAPIKRNNLKTGIKKVKLTPKAVTVLKEDCQAFGLIISKAISLTEAFSYPITSLPLSVATPDSGLRQTDKASLRNFLQDEANATTKNVPRCAGWFVDGLAAVRSLKPKETYGEWIDSLLRFITPPNIACATVTGMVNDTYLKYSAKCGTRKNRGEDKFGRTHVQGFKQHMPSGIKWQEFLAKGENKEELIKLIADYVESLSQQDLLERPFIYTTENQTYRFEDGKKSVLHECNHEEADTRLVLQAFLEETNVVIACKDTDVLILLVWAYAYHQIKNEWFFKYENEKYAEISKICEYLGPQICLVLPAFHALTGCDTTSYFFRAGKVRIFKKLISDPAKCKLLLPLGQEKILGESDIESVKEFIRTVVYSGKEGENYVETRIRLYQNLKSKSSMPLPPIPTLLCR